MHMRFSTILVDTWIQGLYVVMLIPLWRTLFKRFAAIRWDPDQVTFFGIHQEFLCFRPDFSMRLHPPVKYPPSKTIDYQEFSMTNGWISENSKQKTVDKRPSFRRKTVDFDSFQRNTVDYRDFSIKTIEYREFSRKNMLTIGLQWKRDEYRDILKKNQLAIGIFN